MANIPILYVFILLLSIFISSISQVMLKKAAMRNYDSKIKEYLNPLVVIAYIMFIGTTFLTVIAYKEIPLSLGPVLETTSYIYITFFGVKLFEEKLNMKKKISILLIIMGIIVYSFG
ncbi:MAG: multidrug ABC transporter [Lachnospiraceae bacterium]|nr:multidrug ABC transporter [Lachnospiraceae bacterium]